MTSNSTFTNFTSSVVETLTSTELSTGIPTESPTSSPISVQNPSTNDNSNLNPEDIPIIYYIIVLGSLMLCCLVMIMMFYWYHHRNLVKLIHTTSVKQTPSSSFKRKHDNNDHHTLIQVKSLSDATKETIALTTLKDANNGNIPRNTNSLDIGYDDDNTTCATTDNRKETYNTFDTDNVPNDQQNLPFSPDGTRNNLTTTQLNGTPWAVFKNSSPPPPPPPEPQHQHQQQQQQMSMHPQNNNYYANQGNNMNLAAAVGSIPKPAYQASAMPINMHQIPYNQFTNNQRPPPGRIMHPVYNHGVVPGAVTGRMHGNSRSTTVKTGPDLPPTDVRTMLSDITTSSSEGSSDNNQNNNQSDLDDDGFPDSVSTKMRKKKVKKKKSKKKKKLKKKKHKKRKNKKKTTKPMSPVDTKSSIRKGTDDTVNTLNTVTSLHQQQFVEPAVPSALSEVTSSEEDSSTSRDDVEEDDDDDDDIQTNPNIDIKGSGSSNDASSAKISISPDDINTSTSVDQTVDGTNVNVAPNNYID